MDIIFTDGTIMETNIAKIRKNIGLFVSLLKMLYFELERVWREGVASVLKIAQVLRAKVVVKVAYIG